jgi:hypothetical protein
MVLLGNPGEGVDLRSVTGASKKSRHSRPFGQKTDVLLAGALRFSLVGLGRWAVGHLGAELFSGVSPKLLKDT